MQGKREMFVANPSLAALALAAGVALLGIDKVMDKAVLREPIM